MNTTILLAAAMLSPFRPGETVLQDGIVKERIDTCARNILQHLKVQESFVQPFLDRSETDAGQFVGCGMLLDALVKAAAHGAGGDEMKKLKDRVLDQIVSTQGESGRISIFPDENNLGWWDNHDQAYFLQALCREREYTGSKKALEAAVRLGDYLISEKRHTKVNIGIETAFVLLYKATGDARYRDYIAGEFGIKDGMEAYADKLIDARIPHGKPLLHVYSWQARALAESQYADATGDGDPVLRRSMSELWLRAFSPASSISGTMSGPTYEHWSGWGEKWNESNTGLGAWGETCVSAYSLRTLQYMLEHSGKPDPRFGDLYERVMFNAFFAAMSKDGKNYRYFTPFEEKGEWYDRETFCCPNNFRREIFEIPDSVFFKTSGGGLAVAIYIPAVLRSNGCEARLDTDYPKSGKGTVRIGKGNPESLTLRIPSWCEDATVVCGKTLYNPRGGTWLEVPLNGEREVKFDYPVRDRFVKGQRAQSGKVALMRGPVLYGLDENGKTVAFSDERRVHTFFRLSGDLKATDDELLSPARWRDLSCAGGAKEVEGPNGWRWRTWQHQDFSVLENSVGGGEWKVVLVADPDYEGPISAERPSLAVDGDLIAWRWDQEGRRMELRLSAAEEYPSVMRDQARAVE